MLVHDRTKTPHLICLMCQCHPDLRVAQSRTKFRSLCSHRTGTSRGSSVDKGQKSIELFLSELDSKQNDGLKFFSPGRGLREALQPWWLWLPCLPFPVLQTGAKVAGQANAERLPEPPKPQHPDGPLLRPGSLQVNVTRVELDHRRLQCWATIHFCWAVTGDRKPTRIHFLINCKG